MQACNYPTQAEMLKTYDLIDGKLCRKSDGKPAAFMHKGTGRYVIKVKNRNLYLSRLMWIFINGNIPNDMCVDHINQDKTDNRISNLRLVSKADNCRNVVKKSNTSGHRGVTWKPSQNAWYACSTDVDGKRKFLGYHATKEAAAEIVQTFLQTEFPHLY